MHAAEGPQRVDRAVSSPLSIISLGDVGGDGGVTDRATRGPCSARSGPGPSSSSAARCNAAALANAAWTRGRAALSATARSAIARFSTLADIDDRSACSVTSDSGFSFVPSASFLWATMPSERGRDFSSFATGGGADTASFSFCAWGVSTDDPTGGSLEDAYLPRATRSWPRHA